MFESWSFLRNCFLLPKANLWWRWRRLPKIYGCDLIELEFVKKKRYKPFQINQYFKCSSYSGLFLSQTCKSFELGGAWERLVCVIYDFIGETTFCWNHYRDRILKSVRVSKRITSQIYVRNYNKNFGKRVSGKHLKR